MPRFDTSDGYSLYYEELGEGNPPLLVMPGVITAIESSGAVMAPFATRRRLIAFDHIGSGSSARPTPQERSYGLDRQLDDALELLEHLGVERFVAGGWARGSALAVQLALRVPERVEKVVMLGTPLLGARAEQMDYGVALAFVELARTGGDTIAPQAFIEAGIPDATPEQRKFAVGWLAGSTSGEVIGAQLEAFAGAVSLEEAAQVRCPVLLVAGTGDIVVPSEEAETLAAAFPDCRLVLVEGAANGLFYTRPEDTGPAVEKFLS
ncbi:MAG: alpha/beta hydrolase [Thermoleophilaceae bacterium]|nr:alpha/beta hydrolase [Thermoleophilaceae bacterium]